MRFCHSEVSESRRNNSLGNLRKFLGFPHWNFREVGIPGGPALLPETTAA